MKNYNFSHAAISVIKSLTNCIQDLKGSLTLQDGIRIRGKHNKEKPIMFLHGTFISASFLISIE